MAAWVTFTALVLLVPLVAMRFTDEVMWDAFDFVVMCALICGVGTAYELVAANVSASTYRAGLGVALAAAFVMIWVNGAVGLIGNEDDAVNLVFFAVLAVALIGAILARLRPDGMARALFATALAQALVAAVALSAGWGSEGPTWPRDILMATGFFITLWLISAVLFRTAAQRQTHDRRGAVA
jgi:hypothetical protein